MAKRSALGKGLGAFFGDDVVKGESSRKNEAENSEKNKHRNGNNVNNNHSSSYLEMEENHKEGEYKGSENLSLDNENGINLNNSFTEQGIADKENVSRETLIKISRIEPNEGQPRKSFDEETLKELADSMKEYGILQPLLVKRKGDNFQIIAGERRWRAAKMAGLKEVPVIVREYNKQQSVEIALIENVQRADLNPIEEALAYQQLMQEFGLKQEEIALRVSKNRATITNSIRLLKLAEPVQQLLISGEISSGHARALLGLEDKEQQIALASQIIEKGLNVRQVEKLVKMMTKPQKDEKENEESEEKDLSFIFRDLEEKMKGIMGTKVMIHQKDKNKGRIEIEYYSASELERIVELIETIKL
jgi:ParB family chromosome partitioning protein